jgi:uncharacterized membrane protein
MSSEITDRVTARLRELGQPQVQKEGQEYQFGYSSALFIPNWSPSARIAVSSLGILSLIQATRSHGALRKGFSLFGIASLIRAITNLHVTDLIGWIANPSVRIRRAIGVKAPVEDVYDFLSHFENYPRFMSYVENVEVNDQGGLRWTMKGPAGLLFHWDTILGKMNRNQAISWKSSMNTFIRNSGDIQLVELPGEGTEIRIELVYAPPVGALGYAVVHFLGYDPKDKIDEDLEVLRAIIEREFSSNLELVDFRRA